MLLPVSARDDAVLRHGYHTLRVKAVVEETDDARSFVLDVADDLRETFRYRPGQFCTFRVHIGEDEHARCYSMSSAPETDGDLTVTVKRVPGGLVSNWLIDHVSDGDVLEVTAPSGSFCVRPEERPILAFCGGSGITPVVSIAKSVLSGSTKPVRLLYANRDRGSVIFDEELQALADRQPDRLEVRRHFDSDGGFLEASTVVEFVGDHVEADCYICGPAPFMDLVEGTLLELGVEPEAIFIERFVAASPTEAPPTRGADDVDAPESIVLMLRGKKNEVGYRAGETVLETARRADLPAPYSCEAGSCATCMALVREGTVRMRANDALTEDEVAEGWVLTCQSLPTSPSLIIEYEPL
jgi:3-ketosteroid 9alpha-monooxygenase subunit B